MPAATRRRKAAFVGILAPMRSLLAALAALWLAGCSVISVDLTPRVRPLEEETVEGHGHDKILMMDVSGFISDETPGGRRFREGTSPYEVGPKDLADCRKIRQFRAERSLKLVFCKSFYSLLL